LAADAILSAIGGVCTDACGRPIDYTVQEDYTNNWGILLSRDNEYHYSKLVIAAHEALIEAADDPNYTQWPHGLLIPSIEKSSL
jgi:3'-phosphoadenosine 5'-phosphosulfate (PAPS) 3'-phosphatase